MCSVARMALWRRQAPKMTRNKAAAGPASHCFAVPSPNKVRSSRLRLKLSAAHEVALGEVLTAPERGAAQAAVIKHMGEAAFQMLPSFGQQGFAARAAGGAAQGLVVLLRGGAAALSGVGIGDDGAQGRGVVTRRSAPRRSSLRPR